MASPNRRKTPAADPAPLRHSQTGVRSARTRSAWPRPRAAASLGSAGSASAAPSDAAAGLSPNAERCITVGPFRDVAEAAHAASTLRAGGYDPRAAGGRRRRLGGGLGVSAAPRKRRDARDQLLAKLKAAGMDDALVMPGPNEGSVISLGLFSEQKRAQARVVRHRRSASSRKSRIASAPATCTGSTSI